MEILPAIDLLGGQCVRLYQGDYAQSETFHADPSIIARRWVGEGATWLHLVDLDGAKTGDLTNFDAIARIVAAARDEAERRDRSMPQVQVGGGVRDRERVAKLLDLGVTRVILGTIAVEQPDLTAQLCAEFPGQVAIGIDARNGMVATRGWLETSTLAATDLAQRVEAAGAAAIIYTDIHRDGTLQGPNKPALRDMAAAVSIPVIASGGIGSVMDLLGLLSLEPDGVTGVIVGRALYTGDVELREALQAIGPGRIQDIPPDFGQSSLA